MNTKEMKNKGGIHTVKEEFWKAKYEKAAEDAEYFKKWRGPDTLQSRSAPWITTIKNRPNSLGLSSRKHRGGCTHPNACSIPVYGMRQEKSRRYGDIK